MRKLALIIISFLFVAGKCASQNSEADLKAAYIYNFILYTDWDSAGARNTITIGILGPSNIAAPLSDIARTMRIKNKRIIIKRFSQPEDLGSCNVLFISKNLPYSIPSIMERVPKGVLTISEEFGSARQGTAFNFVIVNNKLKFEANLQTIIASGLRVSSKLLKLAIVVN